MDPNYGNFSKIAGSRIIGFGLPLHKLHFPKLSNSNDISGKIKVFNLRFSELNLELNLKLHITVNYYY